jgi:hypothetical protein
MKIRTICLIAVAAATLAASPVLAKDDEAKPAHESRMAACAHEAKGLKGEEYRHSMSECLKSHDTGASRGRHAQDGEVHAERQQDRMKSCNVEAGRMELKGEERRAFMSACLKG